jgi:hypothetical protein
MPGSSGPEPLASCQLLTAKTAMDGVFAVKQARQDAGQQLARTFGFVSAAHSKNGHGWRFCGQASPAGCRAAAGPNLWLRVSCSQQKRPWMAFLRSTQYLGTDAGVERAGGMALGSEKGHQLPLVVCCCGA